MCRMAEDKSYSYRQDMTDTPKKDPIAECDELKTELLSDEEKVQVVSVSDESNPDDDLLENASEHFSDVVECEGTTFDVVDLADADVNDGIDVKEEETVEEQETPKESGEDKEENVTKPSENANNESVSNNSENADSGAQKNDDSDAEANDSGEDEVAPSQEDANANSDDSNELKGHPYRHLILNYNPSTSDLSYAPKYTHPPINKTPCIFVETKEDLVKLSEELMLEKEIGVRSRYSSTTYEVYLCYLLISTRKANYMIDATKLGDSLHLLNNVLTSLNIVKVVHDTKKSMTPLQQHNLWIVNVFDIYGAFKKLHWKDTYWSYVEKHYNVKSEQNLNLGNWHYRPLPEAYRRHAVMFMHFLIPMYHTLKKLLIKNREIRSVMEWSNERCGLLYNPNKTLDVFFPTLRHLQANQAALLLALDEWRHKIAKQKNRSIHMILRNKEMLKLATTMSTQVVEIITIAESVHVENHVNEIQKLTKQCIRIIGPVCENPSKKWLDLQRKQNKLNNKQQKTTVAKPVKNNKPFQQKTTVGRPVKNNKPFQQNKQPTGFTKPFQPQQFGAFNKKGGPVTRPGKNRQPTGFTKPFQQPQFGAFNKEGRPDTRPGRNKQPTGFTKAFGGGSNKNTQGGQFGYPSNGPTRKQHGSPFESCQTNYYENRGKRESSDHHRPFGKHSTTRWDSEPSPKKPKTLPWSNQMPWSSGRSPSPPRPSSPPSYMIVSNKGEVIPIDGANIVSSLLGNSRSHTGGSGGGGGGDRRSNDGPSWGPMNNSSQPNETMNCLNTLINLSSALVSLNKLNMPRADFGNNDSPRQNQGEWMDNSSNEWRNRRESSHSTAPPSMTDYPDDSLSRSYGPSRSPDVASLLNAARNVCLPSQSSNPRFGSSHHSQ